MLSFSEHFISFLISVKFWILQFLQSIFDVASSMIKINKTYLKRDPLEISIQSLKTAYSVLLSLFMRDNGRCEIPYAA